MTPSTWVTRIAPAAAASLLTAVVFAGLLWVQRERQGWPFGVVAEATTASHEGHAAAPPGAVASSAAHQRVAVDVGADAASALGIRLETVGHESISQTVRAVATVVPDESRISHVHTRVAGWVERLEVNTTGQTVRAGQTLARIFSQELLASQTEYLAARRYAASGIVSAVVEGGRMRLRVLGMTDADIAAIEATGEPMPLVHVPAPRSGVVINRGVSLGTSVDSSTELITIADLSRVWIFAEIPERDIAAVKVGTTAMLDFSESGRAPFAARVEFVYPMLSEGTRTLRARLSAANRGDLRPGVYGTATFETAQHLAITVPRDAIVDTGAQQHVFVENDGRFEPRAITVGTTLGDRVEVVTGLAHGERVVAAGVFLLDSESRLRATGGASGHNHGASSSGTPPVVADDPHAGHRE